MNQLEIKDIFVDAIEKDRSVGGDGQTNLNDAIWSLKGRKKKIDWLELEDASRILFQLYAGNQISAEQTLIAISELLGATTGRGVAL